MKQNPYAGLSERSAYTLRRYHENCDYVVNRRVFWLLLTALAAAILTLVSYCHH